MAVASCRKVVQLSRAEKPWRPRHRRHGEEEEEEEGMDPEERQTQELLCCFRGALNKLTPQKLQILLSQLMWVPIYSERHLGVMADMVVERAISETQFSGTYANMCRCLMGLEVPMKHQPCRKVNFRKLLLNRCQAEFEMDLDAEILEKKKIELQIYACIGMQWQKAIKEELEEIREMFKSRLLGIVRFIGELFKLKMVGECIVHECLAKLLRNQTEESLESLCLLLCAIGKDLDYEKAMPYMNQYFHQMEKIIEERQISNRIRFLLKDVIDLRQSKWIPRHTSQTTDGTIESAPASKKKSRSRSRKAPKGPGATVSVLDPQVQAPQQGSLSVHTSLSQEQIPKSPVASVAAGTGAGTVCVVSPLEEDLSCPVCCDIYTDPVLLPCSHSFCRPCLERSWKEQNLQQECLLCRQKTSTRNPTPNLALRNVCEAFLKEKSAGVQALESDVNITETHLPLCPEHGEKVQFYCQDEDQLVCVECVTESHKTHRVCSTKKAASEHRDELECLMKSLEDDARKNKMLLESVMAHIKAQAAQTERQIKDEFEKLHQFLRSEEEARIAALRREERDKTANLEEKIVAIETVISSLSERMKPIQKLIETDEVSFIQKSSEMKERTQEAFLHTQPGFWLLLDVSTYLDNLSHRVWDKMKGMVANSTTMVDSNTFQSVPDLSPPEYLVDILPKCELGMVPPSSKRRGPEVLGADGVTPGWRQLVDEIADDDDD